MILPYALSKLIEGVAHAGPVPVLDVEGINADSRLIGAGEAFFALPGARGHGNIYSRDAAGRGASVLVTDKAPKADPGIPVVLVRRAGGLAPAALVRASSPKIALR